MSRGKAAAKRKFKVYPSAYANAYASKICAGKIKDPSGVKEKILEVPNLLTKQMAVLLILIRFHKKEKGIKNLIKAASLEVVALLYPAKENQLRWLKWQRAGLKSGSSRIGLT